MTVRVYALNCGTLEFERRSFFPETQRGVAMRVPVPAFLLTHPQGKVLFDTGIHANGFHDPVAHFGEALAAYFKFFCGAGAVWNADEMRHSLGVLRRMRDREGLALIHGHDEGQLRTLRAAPEAFA